MKKKRSRRPSAKSKARGAQPMMMMRPEEKIAATTQGARIVRGVLASRQHRPTGMELPPLAGNAMDHRIIRGV